MLKEYTSLTKFASAVIINIHKAVNLQRYYTVEDFVFLLAETILGQSCLNMYLDLGRVMFILLDKPAPSL
jgi:hypothetical protein